MPYRHIDLERDGDVAVLRLCRPEVRNALSGADMLDEIIDAIRSCVGVGALVVTGVGDAFSGGGNVKDMRARTGLFAEAPASELVDRYRSGIQRVLRVVSECEAVTVAAVNGSAVGAGLDLALACDLRYCSPNAVFAVPFLTLGLIPGDGGMAVLVRAVGYQRAAEMLFTGRRLRAPEAVEAGLVLRVHEREELLDATRAVAREAAAQPPAARRLAKRLLRLAADGDGRALSELSAAYQAILQSGAEHRAAVEAVLR